MTKKLQVLQLHPEYNVKSSDVSDLAEQIIKSLPTERYEVTSAYMCGHPRSGQPLSIANHSHYFNLQATDLKGLRLKALWKLFRFCTSNRFDIIICNRFKTVSMLLLLNRLLKIPLCIGISHVLDEYNRRYRRLQVKFLADKRWQFIGVSEAVRTWLINYKSGFTTQNTHAIANAIDIAKAESTQLERHVARARLNLPQDKLIIGAIGQLLARKGHRYLISALSDIKDKFPDAHIGIIGKGPEEQNLMQQIIELGLNDRVHLLGFKDNALQYVRAFDIWTMPSLKEGLPLALMEGMSGHLPVIGTNIPEMKGLIMDAGGITVPPKDVATLSRALEDYLKLNSEELISKGEEVFNYLNKAHTIEQYRSSYLHLIEKKFKEHI